MDAPAQRVAKPRDVLDLAQGWCGASGETEGIVTTSSAPPRPARSVLTVDAFPAPLRGRDQWACFRYGFRDGSWTKIPKQPNRENAKSNDPTTWSSFKDALAAFEADQWFDGIGYIFSEDDPY